LSWFDLQDSRAEILQTYEAICAKALAFPLGSRLPDFSRINQDGTPLQFATHPGAPFRSLQFLGEVGWPGASGGERLQAGRECVATLAGILDTDAAWAEAQKPLSFLAPDNDPDLLGDPAGVFWIGAAFAPARHPQLRIYVNGSWGRKNLRWTRLRRFASHFGALETWMDIERLLAPEMKPLGSALTLANDGTVTGRIYVSAYGKTIDYYQALAQRVSGGAFADVLRQYGDCLLGQDRAYPTPNAVCSFGLGAGRDLDFKFELCVHCLFSSDVDASERLRRCFDSAGVDMADYLYMLEILSKDGQNHGATELHTYAGVGVRNGERYFSVYLKPKLV
jgi:hypothetical protein